MEKLKFKQDVRRLKELGLTESLDIGYQLSPRGEAVLEGDLHPFMAHLQYFKDLLALPRQRFAAAVS